MKNEAYLTWYMNNRNKIFLFLDSVLVAVIATLLTAKFILPEVPAPSSVTPPAIKNLLSLNSSYKVLETWNVTDQGNSFKGWYLDLAGVKQVYWSQGNFVIAGGLVDGTGENLTEKWAKNFGGTTIPAQAQAQTAAQPTSDTGSAVMKSQFSNADWESLKAAKHIEAGYDKKNPDKALYVFFEPYCGYCSRLFKQLRPVIEENHLDVRLIPVAWISPNSVPAIQAMMDGGKDAFWAHEDAKTKGEVGKLGVPTPETKMAIIQNSELMGTMQVQGTPAIFYRDSNGSILRLSSSAAAVQRVIADMS